MTVAPRSPLELVHPEGVAPRACVLGDTLPAHCEPDSSSEGPYDLIVVAPPSGVVTKGWAGFAASFAAAELAPDGVAYVLTRRLERPRLRRLVAQHGLLVELEIAHLPDLSSSVLLVPLEPAPMRFALEQLMLLPAWIRRAATVVLSRRRALRLAPSSVGFVVRRPGARASFDWLAQLGGTTRASAVISRSRPGAGPGFFVLLRFSDGDLRPSAVAKIAPAGEHTLERESSALVSIAHTARAAGADIPAPLASATLGTAQVLLLGSLRGQLAATLLAKSPKRLETVAGEIARWLAEWGRATAAPLVLTRDFLQRTLVDPARVVAEHVSGGRAYVDWIERVCAAAEGRELVGTAAHNDLTMWNVIVREGDRLGVVDWESATDRSLPLVDFYYAAADAVAATDAYADRTGSFGTAFVDGQGVGRLISGLEERMIDELRIEGWAAELCFHACWLNHARNELQRLAGTEPGPFVRIVETIASHGGALRTRACEHRGEA